ncbi:MAG: YdcF family protein [Rhizobiaceae bacterium]|nr:YdcF family protein [Rhizobiaceae bacterium]
MAMVKYAPIDSTAAHRRSLVAALRLAAFGCIAAAGLFAGGFGLFATHVSELAAPDDVEPADAIIVLTGGQSRIDTALSLLKSGKGKRLLISGVHPSATQEALRVANGGDRELFTCCVDIDYAALDTIGNADESAKWMRSNHFDSVILVTNNYHMPRSLLEMHRSLSQATLEPYPVVNTQLRHGGWLTKPEALRVIFMEYAKFLAAAVRIAVTPPAHDLTAESLDGSERSAELK